MLKQIVFSLATLIFSNNMYGQHLSIELSVEWKKEETGVYNKFELKYIPYLRITYNNLTDKFVYFLKVYKNNDCLPMFPAGTLGIEYKQIDLDNANVPDIKRNVFIGGMPPNNLQWEVLPDSIKFCREHEIEEINEILSTFYETVFQSKKKNKSEYCSPITNLTAQQILREIKDDFIFLSPNEKYSEYYNLIGFDSLGGCYSFMLSVDKVSDHLKVNPSWNQQQKKWIFKKIMLPKKVEKYFLYSGKFYTNKITVKF